MSKQELQDAQGGELAEAKMTESAQVMAMIQSGIDKGLSPEAMEKLVALQERIMDRNAKGDFIAAMGRFQSECPVIVKRREVKNRNGQTMYRYAPLEDIVAQVKDLERTCGFSHSFNTVPMQGGGIEVTCTVRHASGHAESTTVPVPATQGQNTNAAQNAGIALQYGQRYSFIGAFGLTTADEDTDGNQQGYKPITHSQHSELLELVQRAQPDMEKLLKYLLVDDLKDLPEQDFHRAKSALHKKIADNERAEYDADS